MKKIMLVTVVHDRKQYLRECLDSALKSTLPKDQWVHLVIDSGSNQPECREIIKEYCDKWDHMYYKFFDENINQMPAYNWALDWVRENYPEIDLACCLDSDDWISTRALNVAVKEFKARPELGFVFSDFNMIDGNGKVMVKRHPKSKRRVPKKIELTKEGQRMLRVIQVNKKSGNIATHLRCFRISEWLEKVGRIREDYLYSTDFVFYCEALLHEINLGKIDEVLYHWRNQSVKGNKNPTKQVEKDHGDIQHNDYLALRDEYERKFKERGLI